MTSMLYISVSLWAGDRYCEHIVQRCIDCVLTTMGLDTQIGVCRGQFSIEISA